MKSIIRLTESDLHMIIKESVGKILKEMAGDGALSDAGLDANGTGDPSMDIKYPAFGGKSKKKVGGNAFSEPILKQAHNLGDVTKAPANQVDMKPALDRTPGFSMGERKK